MPSNRANKCTFEQATCFKNSLSTTKCSPQDISCLCADSGFQNTVQLCLGSGVCTPKEVLSKIFLLEFYESANKLATTNATSAACGLPEHDIKATMIGIPATFGSLAIIFVLFRIYARLFINKFFAWDDRLIVAALVRLLSFCSELFLMVPGVCSSVKLSIVSQWVDPWFLFDVC